MLRRVALWADEESVLASRVTAARQSGVSAPVEQALVAPPAAVAVREGGLSVLTARAGAGAEGLAADGALLLDFLLRLGLCGHVVCSLPHNGDREGCISPVCLILETRKTVVLS